MGTPRRASSIGSEASEKASSEETPLFSHLQQSVPVRPGTITGLHRADAALVFATRFRNCPGHYLWLCADNQECERIAQNIRFFLPAELSGQVIVLPGAEADPYRGLSPHPEILAARSLGLWRVARMDSAFVLTTVSGLMPQLISPIDFADRCIELEVGGFVPPVHLLERLRSAGYVSEDPVSEFGEFSVRGGIIDVFSPSRAYPVRIEMFGDEIESIREFDPSTQRSVGLVPQCDIVPMHELAVTKREIQRWHQSAPDHWADVRFAEELQEKMQFTDDGELFNGYEGLLPLVVETGNSLLQYRLAPDPGLQWQLILDDAQRLSNELDQRYRELAARYEDRSEANELVLAPARLFQSREWWEDLVEESETFFIDPTTNESGDDQVFDFHSETQYQGRIPDLIQQIGSWRERGDRIVFVMSTWGMAERLQDILKEYDVAASLVAGGLDGVRGPIAITHGALSESFSSRSLGTHFLTQSAVFGDAPSKPSQRKVRKPEVRGPFLSDFRDLKPGDFVVHVDHGIGEFVGLKKIGVADDSREFVLLSYRGGSKLYVPTDRLDLLQKYGSIGHSKPQLDKLGGASWSKTKSRIKKAMRDMAEELLKLYAKRAVAQGHGFAPDDEMMREFEDAFEFDETTDQRAAILDVKKDMESETPMDRLICGDVGYGKTEVAMRAAFKAVEGDRQVALLAPTTVLAFQHFNTFRQRCQGFPVNVEMISRFRSRKEQVEILDRVNKGRIDILIGTHRMLSKDVKFDRLGLIVVDEEQRFGVAQKERLKKLKTKVDVLTLSATPIPRTLNMSMIGLRDLSIIETPPKDRLAIQTVVVKFGREIIRSAIDLEMKRKGQTFFLYNKVETIHSIAQMIKDTVPEARVAVAHGQMRESMLEEVMMDFLDYKYDVLVSTTIIENGIDIPNANKLIVNRADRFGLSQLYQLRGRVGRSSRRAYSYLLIPSEETLSTDARRRLKAIREFSDLGAGFRIAALDLEIRGAGNLLGGEQHGHINAVGFELYTKLLEKAIQELKSGKVEDDVPTAIDLKMDIQIPEHYIEEPNTRLWLYKRVSSVSGEQEMESLREETLDRSGRFPRSVSNLFEYSRLRLRGGQMKILSIDKKGGQILIKFSPETPISPERIIQFMSSRDSTSLTPEGVLSVGVESSRPSEVFGRIHGFLDELAVLQ